jgi:uncharacterized phage-associated protein
MSVSAEAVANAFLALARGNGRSLTNMQLQKLVYIAHGYHLAIFNDALINERPRAWQFGPVFPKLYKKLSRYGPGFVTADVEAPDKVCETTMSALISKVWGAYGDMTGGRLSAMTHREGSPWSQTWELEQYAAIPEDTIRDHYKALIDGKRDAGH